MLRTTYYSLQVSLNAKQYVTLGNGALAKEEAPPRAELRGGFGYENTEVPQLVSISPSAIALRAATAVTLRGSNFQSPVANITIYDASSTKIAQWVSAPCTGPSNEVLLRVVRNLSKSSK